MRRLPPLAALRAFEAVGRLQNVKNAASELNVTPAAVTHHIRQLEDYLNVELFNRSNKGMIWTREGQEYFATVTRAFDLLHEGTRQTEANRRSRVNVNSLPSFATCWLVPRLPRFYASNPGIELEINIVGNPGQPIDFNHLGADVAIRVGNTPDAWDGFAVEKLVHEQMFPVCAPRLLEGPNALRHPDDLARYPLIIVSRRPEGWPEWLQAAQQDLGCTSPIDPEQGLRFDTIHMATTAAVEGLGIAIGRTPLVNDYLEAGLLVAPFPLQVRSKAAYWLVGHQRDIASEPVQAFRDWLRYELGF